MVILPLTFAIQLHLRGDLPARLAFNKWLVYLSLAAAVLVCLPVLAGKAERRHLVYALPVPLLFSLVWTPVRSFRFVTLCREGYHFWIPVVRIPGISISLLPDVRRECIYLREMSPGC